MELLREVRAGKVGLWAMRGPAYFADFSFTPTNRTIKGTPAETEDAPAGTVMSWSVSDTFDGTSLNGKFTLAEDDKQNLTWSTLATERTGLANFARVQGLGEGKDTVYARVTVTSDREQMKMLRFGFSDRVKVYFNDQLIFGGNDVYGSRDYRFLGTSAFTTDCACP